MAVDKLVDSAQLNSDLTSVANAIRAKSGGSGSLSFPSGFISEIGNIPSGGGGGGGGGSVSEDALNFFDADGNIVESYSKAEALALESLPENPTKTGLVPQGWNWTLAEIKDYYTSCPDGIINVGQMYTTDDGKTRIYIHLEEERKSPMVALYVNGTVDVDWGDGTEHSTLTGTSATSSTERTSPHEYEHGGDYVIKLTVNGQFSVFGTSSGGYGSIVRGYTSDGDYRNRYYSFSISRIEFGNGFVGIRDYGFYYNPNLRTITLPTSLTTIGKLAFHQNSSLSFITIPNTVTNMSTSGDAFGYCSSLEHVSLPTGITGIGSGAFEKCFSLKSITIPKNVTILTTSIFDKCISLKKIVIPRTVTTINDSICKSCSALKNVIMYDGITTIGVDSFRECSSLSAIALSSTLNSIGRYALYRCTPLKNVVLPDGITTIPNYLLSYCSNLKSISIPSNVTSIGTEAFSYCDSLVSITVPSGVTQIGNNAFSYCVSVKEYHFLSITPPTLGSSAFNGIPKDCIIYVPVGSLEAYQTASNWSTYASYMQEEPQ